MVVMLLVLDEKCVLLGSRVARYGTDGAYYSCRGGGGCYDDEVSIYHSIKPRLRFLMPLYET